MMNGFVHNANMNNFLFGKLLHNIVNVKITKNLQTFSIINDSETLFCSKILSAKCIYRKKVCSLFGFGKILKHFMRG